MTLLLFYYVAVIFKQNIKKKNKPNSQYLGQSKVTTTNTAVTRMTLVDVSCFSPVKGLAGEKFWLA